MAKSVDLSGGKPPPPSAAELMARVTGQARPPAPGFTPPPPAGGVRGKPPIPKNVPVFTPDINSLTDTERAALQKLDWKPGEQVTGDVADLIAEVEAANAAEREEAYAKVAASGRPAAQFKPVDVAQLPPDQQAEVRRRMTETMAAAQRADEVKANLQAAGGMPASVRDALRVAEAPTGLEVEDDRPARRADPPPAAAPAPAAADTGLAPAHPGNCPHCGWDQAVPDDAEVTPRDKTAFLHAVLGEKPFTKEFELFGGSVTVTFRTLTGQEIDKVFQQAYHEKRRGEILTDMDFYERVNRYRLYLQLQAVRGPDFAHDFPDGFTPATNPGADGHYTLPADLPEGETGLRQVEDHVRRTALKTEVMIRTVTVQCRTFNRVVAKLEAFADNPDFWQATGG